MALEAPESIQVTAGQDLSSSQFRAVTLAGTIAANNTTALGISQDRAGNGRHTAVGFLGKSRFVAGAAINSGAAVMVTTSGYFIAANTNQFGVGVALASVSSGLIGRGLFNFIGVKSSVVSAHMT